MKCVKLPRVRASLSRHSNCYAPLKPLLGARLACHRLFPPPGVTNFTSVTPINLAGERNGGWDCFARVKINAPFLSCFAHSPLFLFPVRHVAFLPFLTGLMWTFRRWRSARPLLTWRGWAERACLESESRALSALSTADKGNGPRQTLSITWLQMERIISSKGQKCSLVRYWVRLQEVGVSNHLFKWV